MLVEELDEQAELPTRSGDLALSDPGPDLVDPISQIRVGQAGYPHGGRSVRSQALDQGEVLPLLRLEVGLQRSRQLLHGLAGGRRTPLRERVGQRAEQEAEVGVILPPALRAAAPPGKRVMGELLLLHLQSVWLAIWRSKPRAARLQSHNRGGLIARGAKSQCGALCLIAGEVREFLGSEIPPDLRDLAGMRDVQEPVLVQALVPELPVLEPFGAVSSCPI